MSGRRWHWMPITFLWSAIVFVLLASWAIYAFVAVYATYDTPGWLQGLRYLTHPIALVAGFIVVVLGILSAVALRSRFGWVLAGVLVVAIFAGPVLAGELGARGKNAALPQSIPCEAPADAGAAWETAARAVEAIRSLDHPSPFVGNYLVDAHHCSAALATDRLDRVLEFYRTELPGKGWTITEDGATRLVATKGDATFSVGTPGEIEHPEAIEVSVRFP